MSTSLFSLGEDAEFVTQNVVGEGWQDATQLSLERLDSASFPQEVCGGHHPWERCSAGTPQVPPSPFAQKNRAGSGE